MQQGRLALCERLAKHQHQHTGHLPQRIFQPVGRIALGCVIAQDRRLRVQSLYILRQDQAGGVRQIAARCLRNVIAKLRHHLAIENSGHAVPAQRVIRQHTRHQSAICTHGLRHIAHQHFKEIAAALHGHTRSHLRDRLLHAVAPQARAYVVNAETQVVSQLLQQTDLFDAGRLRFGRIQRQHAQCLPAVTQRQSQHTAVAAGQCLPGQLKISGSGLQIWGFAHLIAADRITGRTRGAARPLGPAQLHAAEVARLMAGMGHGLDAARSIIAGVADPGHAVATHIDGQPANLAEQLQLVFYTGQGAVALTEQLQSACAAGKFDVSQLACSDVSYGADHALTHQMRKMANPDDIAIRLDHPALDLGRQTAHIGFYGSLDGRQVIRMHGAQITARLVIKALQLAPDQAFAGRADIEQLTGGGVAAVKNIFGIFGELAKALLAGFERSQGLLKRLIWRIFFHH